MCNLSAAFRTARTEQMQGQEIWSVIFDSTTGEKIEQISDQPFRENHLY